VGEPTFIRGTGAFASGKESGQKTFREEYVLPYSLICFYGIINENAAKYTNLTEQDLDLLLDGIWNGTKNLISRSKVGQIPRLLLQVVYKEKNYHIGELDHRINLVSDKSDEKIRNISEIKLDVTSLTYELEQNKQKIEKICYAKDRYLELVKDGHPIEIDKLVSNITFEPLSF
jgi:CRISPR-associated protein Csh2